MYHMTDKYTDQHKYARLENKDYRTLTISFDQLFIINTSVLLYNNDRQ